MEDSVAPIRDGNGLVIGAVMVFRDGGAALERWRQALCQAQHDALTHLPNRSLLNDHLAQAIQLCKRYRKPLAVGFLDVDGLKAVNDTHGHAVGDRVLSSVASRLRQSLRQSDSGTGRRRRVRAMYNAKRRGHGTCQFFEPGMTFSSSSVCSGTAG